VQPLSQSNPHHVVVDDRERSSSVHVALQRTGATIEVNRLRDGDYKIDDRLLVERKTVRDLALSVMSGRIFLQARRLAAPSGYRSCVVVEGQIDDARTGGLSRSGFHGAIISLTMVFNLPVFRSASPAETAHLILLAANQLRGKTAAYPKRYGRKSNSRWRSRMLMLQEIPSVGPGRAANLLKTFANPSGLASASLDQIEDVSGIGPATAKRIWTTFHDL
jgi:ERCC4-type nuclease